MVYNHYICMLSVLSSPLCKIGPLRRAWQASRPDGSWYFCCYPYSFKQVPHFESVCTLRYFLLTSTQPHVGVLMRCQNVFQSAKSCMHRRQVTICGKGSKRNK